MKIFSSKNKKGVTLVEVVFGAVILAFFATGVLSLLISANNSIDKNYEKSFALSAASQKLDIAITLLSGGTEAGYLIESGEDEEKTWTPDFDKLAAYLETDESGLVLEPDNRIIEDGAGNQREVVRGWKITLTYNGVTVKGYASNTQGAFNYDEVEEE